MMETATMEHLWVKHVVTPVEVLTSDQGEPIVLVDPDQQTISEDNAAYGCDRCGKAMVDAVGTGCEGEQE